MIKRIHSIIQGVIAGISFGSASIIARLLINLNINVYTIAFSRVVIASIIILIILISSERYLIRSMVEIIKYRHEIFIMGVLLGLHFIFFISSVRDTLIINATVLVNTVPIITLVIGVLLYKLEIGISDVIMVLIAFLGIIIINFEGLGNIGNLIGNLEAVIAAVFEALYLNIGSKVRKYYNILILMLPIYLISGLTIFIYTAFINVSIYIPVNFTIIILIILIGLLPTAVGHTLLISSLKGLKSHETATLALLEPISATFLALIIFTELPSIYSILGATLIFSSVIMISYGKQI